MANHDTHALVGMIAGALFTARRANGRATLGDIVLGALGGYLGARGPDVLDPPTSPNHRHVAHAVIPSAYCGAAYLRSLNDWQETLRQAADNLRYARQFISDPNSRMKSEMAEALLLLIAGILPGLFAGYASHLALDAMTPRGLPLFTRNL